MKCACKLGIGMGHTSKAAAASAAGIAFTNTKPRKAAARIETDFIFFAKVRDCFWQSD